MAVMLPVRDVIMDVVTSINSTLEDHVGLRLCNGAVHVVAVHLEGGAVGEVVRQDE